MKIRHLFVAALLIGAGQAMAQKPLYKQANAPIEERIKDLIGEPVIRILDPTVFAQVKKTGRSVRNQRTYLAEYKKYVEQTVVYDPDSHMLIGIMRDITEYEAEREKKSRINQQTLEVADTVVAKQMRIVQEIASLLGETAAETKIALTKLKESIGDE